MTSIKSFFVQLFVMCLLSWCFSACTANKEVMMTGKIVKKPWTKSVQSYCAQGSNYFVLQVKEGEGTVEYVLEPGTKNKGKKLERIEGKNADCRGKMITKEIRPAHENSPQPISISPDGGEDSDVFRCEVFKVYKIKTID